MSKTLRFYGASDDLFECEGAITEEVGCFSTPGTYHLKSAEGELLVIALYGVGNTLALVREQRDSELRTNTALEQQLQQSIRQHFLAGYDDGHSRGLNMGKLYKGDDQTILHRRACVDAYIAGDEGD